MNENIQGQLQALLDDALRTYKANRDAHADAVSIAFDAGRVDGLKEALEAIERQK